MSTTRKRAIIVGVGVLACAIVGFGFFRGRSPMLKVILQSSEMTSREVIARVSISNSSPYHVRVIIGPQVWRIETGWLAPGEYSHRGIEKLHLTSFQVYSLHPSGSTWCSIRLPKGEPCRVAGVCQKSYLHGWYDNVRFYADTYVLHRAPEEFTLDVYP